MWLRIALIPKNSQVVQPILKNSNVNQMTFILTFILTYLVFFLITSSTFGFSSTWHIIMGMIQVQSTSDKSADWSQLSSFQRQHYEKMSTRLKMMLYLAVRKGFFFSSVLKLIHIVWISLDYDR